MRRKLISQGKGALTVSLPKRWITQHSLQASQELDIQDNANELIIRPVGTPPASETDIDLDYLSPEAYRSLLGSLYRGGYDSINVSFHDTRVLKNLEHAVNSIYGFEVFYTSEQTCVIKSIYDAENTSIQDHYRRMVYIIQSMHALIVSDFKKRVFQSKPELLQLRNNVLKQRDLIVRVIKKQKLLDNMHFPYYQISLSLWGIARNLYHLYRDQQNTPVGKEGITLLDDVGSYFTESFRNITQRDNESLLQRHTQYETIYAKAQGLLGNESVAAYCMSIILDIQLCESSFYLLWTAEMENKQ